MEAKDIINVLETARDLMKFGHTTTLDIKEELRRRFPNKKWFQSDVSDIMIEAFDDKLIKNLQFTDNGNYRHYFISKPAKVQKVKVVQNIKPKKLSRTDIVDLMKESKGKFYTVVFIKKDGTERTMNGQTKKSNFMDNLGYINFRESNGKIRRVNPQTLLQISIGGQIYKVK